MSTKSKKTKFPSELRYDLISGDWVSIAVGRAKRPELFKKEKREKIVIPKKLCPFCNIETQERPLLVYSQGKEIPLGEKIPKNWTTVVIPNKFPAFLPGKIEVKKEGRFYQRINGVGFCELVVTRDHQKHFPHFEVAQIKEIIDVYQKRYLDLMKRDFVHYVSIFHNHGKEAGASQPHPHSQIITIPLIDIDLKKALSNSEKYFKKDKKCIYCQMNEWERKAKKRLVFENKDFLVLCPFASKSAFEVIVSPKFHSPYFEKIEESQKWNLAEAFQVVMKKLYKALNDPPYNFYLHTAPSDGKDYPFYHWHFTILPKTSIPAGFEMGVKIEISTIEPEKAAEYLRKQ
jgi:UDPglucose--hexose-1-phosphate uridylyltransferase